MPKAKQITDRQRDVLLRTLQARFAAMRISHGPQY